MWSRCILLVIAAAASPAAAGAHVIWPAALLTERLLAWRIIGVSLIFVPGEDYREVSPGIVGK